MTEIRNHIGLKVFVSAAKPATNDAAGFAALTWTPVANPTQAPAFGFTHAAIEAPDLEAGINRSIKGMGAGAESTMAFILVDADAGQVIVRDQARSSQGTLSVKIGYPDGAALAAGDDVVYAQGYVGSYTPNPRDGTNYRGFTVTFKQDLVEVNATQPA